MLRMKDKIEVLKVKLIRLALHIGYIFPVRKNRIMFSSLTKGTNYACNPKYICESMKAQYPGMYELIWGFNEPERFRGIPGIRPVKYRSVRWLYYYMTAKVIVANMSLPVYIPKRKGQFIVQTFHGHPYKRCGLSRKDVTPMRAWGAKQVSSLIDLFVNSSDTFYEELIKSAFGYDGEIINCGMPRNDPLLDRERRESISERVRRELGLAEYVVLYAPTFRKEGPDGVSAKTMMPYKEAVDALRKRTGKSVSFLVRSHHYDRGEAIVGDGIVDVSGYPDIQELYCASDMLITDYSSCMWDFSLMRRPCLLYVPDYEDYGDHDRGFYLPIGKWPGIACYNKEDLIRRILDFDENKCAEIAENYLKESGCCESGTAAKQVCERMIELMEK